MRTETEQIARCRDIIRALGGERGWVFDILEVTSLLHLAAISGKALGVPLEEMKARLDIEWSELPETSELRALLRMPGGMS